MKQKIFCALALIAVFAVFTFGGCGGSDTASIDSNEPAQNSTILQRSLSDSEMASVMGGEKFSAMWDELTASGVIQKLGNWYLIYNISEEAQARILSELSGEERTQAEESFFNAEKVKAKYDSGEVVAIAYPDEDIINKVLAAAGEKPDYFIDESAKSGHIEIYAIAKEKVNDQAHTFSYSVPKLADMTSDDEALEDDEDFQVERWRDFFTWAAERSDVAKENALTAAEFSLKAAAADSITAVGGSHTITLNESRRGTATGVTLYGPGKSLDGQFIREALEWSYVMSARLTYRTFAAHSFTDGKDYYLVRANLSAQQGSLTHGTPSFTVPKRIEPLQAEILGGFFRGYVLASYINAGYTHANPAPSMTEAVLIDYMPSGNIGMNDQYSGNILWDAGGIFTAAGAKGVTTNGLMYGRNNTWQTSDYSITDNSMNLDDHYEKTYWSIDIAVPDETASGLVAKPASINRYKEDFEWLWEVDKSFWQPRTSTSMHVKFASKHGATVLPLGDATEYFSRTEDKMGMTSSEGVNLKEPPHVAVSQRDYVLTAHGGENAGFQIYSESDWTVSSDVDWINLAETSGKATGDSPHWLFFDLSDNATGAARSGTITLSANTRSNEKSSPSSAVLPETITIQVSQRGN